MIKIPALKGVKWELSELDAVRAERTLQRFRDRSLKTLSQPELLEVAEAQNQLLGCLTTGRLKVSQCLWEDHFA